MISWACRTRTCVAKPAKVLLDMFPNLPEQALLSILRNSQGDFSAAVDEALTIASLGNPCDAGEATKAYRFLLQYKSCSLPSYHRNRSSIIQ